MELFLRFHYIENKPFYRNRMQIFSSLLYFLLEHGREVMHCIFFLAGFNFFEGKQTFLMFLHFEIHN